MGRLLWSYDTRTATHILFNACRTSLVHPHALSNTTLLATVL
jgi:hypothetical protein